VKQIEERIRKMSRTKDKVIELIKTLPDDVTIDDIMEEIYFKSQVDEGLTQLDRGEGTPHEDVEKRMSRWLSQ
jgi:predicted transcriptional regulator